MLTLSLSTIVVLALALVSIFLKLSGLNCLIEDCAIPYNIQEIYIIAGVSSPNRTIHKTDLVQPLFFF